MPASTETGESKASPGATSGVLIDAGGGASGSFVADTDFSGGSTYSTTAAINTSGVSQPGSASRLSNRTLSATSPIPSPISPPVRSYTVRLDFAELYWNAAGDRLFNVSINGQQVLTNFDIFATAGGKDIAIAESFTATANSSGQIVIDFTHVKDNAKVSGIEITPLSAPVAPGAPTGLTATAGTSQVSLAWNAVSGATSYNLYRGTTSGGETLLRSRPHRHQLHRYRLDQRHHLLLSNHRQSTAPARAAAPTKPVPRPWPLLGGGQRAHRRGRRRLRQLRRRRRFQRRHHLQHQPPPSTPAASANPAPQSVYQTERYGNFTYTVPNLTPGASYTVRLDFAEILLERRRPPALQRHINSQQVLTNFDIFAAAGGKDKAIAKTFTATANSSGPYHHHVHHRQGQRQGHGIEITPTSAPVVPAAPTGLTATAGTGQVSLSGTPSAAPPATTSIAAPAAAAKPCWQAASPALPTPIPA